jgi:outer membrane protein assembly factor BamE (lipoprotein component of BamABCDE complex)
MSLHLSSRCKALQKHLILAAFVLTGLAGCVAVDQLATLQPGATEADATKLAGKPTYVWNNPDGTRTLEYTDQPFNGNATWMVNVDASGKVLSRALVDIDNAHVPNGMTTEEVRRMLGTPRAVSHFPLPNEDIWDWNMRGHPGDVNLTRFNVHFRDGKVVRTTTNTITECTMFSC